MRSPRPLGRCGFAAGFSKAWARVSNGRKNSCCVANDRPRSRSQAGDSPIFADFAAGFSKAWARVSNGWKGRCCLHVRPIREIVRVTTSQEEPPAGPLVATRPRRFSERACGNGTSSAENRRGHPRPAAKRRQVAAAQRTGGTPRWTRFRRAKKQKARWKRAPRHESVPAKTPPKAREPGNQNREFEAIA